MGEIHADVTLENAGDREAEAKLEAPLNELGEAGFRVRELGTFVILERDETADPVATAFRVVTTSRLATLEAEIAAAGRDGYRPVGLTPRTR